MSCLFCPAPSNSPWSWHHNDKSMCLYFIINCTVCDMCHSHSIYIGQSMWFGTNSCGIQTVSGYGSIKLGNLVVINSTHNNSRLVMHLLMSLSSFTGSTQFHWFHQPHIPVNLNPS